MQRIVPTAAMFLLLLFSVVPLASATNYTVDGDVSDWGIITWSDLNNVTLSSSSAMKTTGDGTLGPGGGGQDYDVEAMFFDSDSSYGYLAIITGFMLGGYQSGVIHFDPGDIGIDVNGSNASVLDYGNSYYNDPTSYEHGINIPDNYDGSPVTVDLMAVSEWEGVYYQGHEELGDPWTIKDGLYVGDVLFAYGSPFDGHYVYEFSFLLSDLGISLGDAINFHWTMECGNDFLNLPATVNHAPEPASMMLLGTGLIGLAAVSRQKFQK